MALAACGDPACVRSALPGAGCGAAASGCPAVAAEICHGHHSWMKPNSATPNRTPTVTLSAPAPNSRTPVVDLFVTQDGNRACHNTRELPDNLKVLAQAAQKVEQQNQRP